MVKNGTEVKAYSVIVDVREPIRFETTAVSATVIGGTNHFMKVTTFVNQGNHPVSIIGVDHSNQVPAGTAAVRGSATVPSGGLKGGEREDVFATISAQTWPAGTYGVTASFKPRFIDHPEADDLLGATPLRITSTIQ